MAQQRCSGTNKRGERCAGFAVAGSAYCLAHDPAKIVQMAAARRKGGAATSHKARARKQLPAEPMSAVELHSWLGVVFRGVVTGKIEPGVGTAAATIARAMLDLARVADFEGQLTEIRADLADLVAGGGAG